MLFSKRLRQCVILVLLILVLFLFYCVGQARQCMACIINYAEPYMLLYFFNESSETAFDRKFYYVKTTNVNLVSFDESIKTYDDVKPGMLVNITFKDDYAVVVDELIDPSILKIQNIAKISTFGQTNTSIINRGIEELKEYGFECKDGRVLPILFINS